MIYSIDVGRFISFNGQFQIFSHFKKKFLIP
jgi:hypothetical protein